MNSCRRSSNLASFGRLSMNRRLTSGKKKLGPKATKRFSRQRKKLKMESPLRILHLEDDPDDAVLVQSTLKAGGIACTTFRVHNQVDFVAALERGGIDLILSDFSLP